MSTVRYLGPIEPVDRGSVRIIDTGDPNLPIDWADEGRQAFVQQQADPLELLALSRKIDRFFVGLGKATACVLGVITAIKVFGWHV